MPRCNWCGKNISMAAQREMGVCSACTDRGTPLALTDELVAACEAALRQFGPRGHYVDPYHPISKVLDQLTDAVARAKRER